MPRKAKVREGKKYQGLTEDGKRALLISEGRRIEYFACPLCGLNRVINRREKGRIRFDYVDLKEGVFLLVRYGGGGYGSGFYADISQSKRLDEIKDNPEYADLLEQIKLQCRAILEELK